MMTKDELAFTRLSGRGVEFGALHNPVKLDPSKTTVIYADKLKRAEAIAAFPEIEDVAEGIVESDIRVDLDRDSLEFIGEQQLDFVVANHVIEHLVNPIRFLKLLSNNLKSGGLVFLTVPNMRFTHDQNRKLTRYRTLVAKYYLGTKHLSNERIRDYLKYKLPVTNIHPRTVEFFEQNNLPLSYYDGNQIPLNPFSRHRLFGYHRSRSIHVHVWDRETFNFFLNRTIDLFKLQFSVDYYAPAEVSEGEMIYLLKRK